MCKTIDESKSRPDVGCTELLSPEREKLVRESMRTWHDLWLKDRCVRSKSVVDSYAMELKTGIPHCAVHLKPFWGAGKCPYCQSPYRDNADLTGKQKPEKEVSNV